MLVQDVMSTGVITAYQTDSVRSAVIKMLSRHCGAIPVIDQQRNLIGLVAIRDVMIPLFPNYGDYIHDNVHSRDFGEMEEGYPDSLRKKVEEIMSKNPLTVSPTTCILEAASYMGLKHFRHRNHEVIVFHVLDPREMDLDYRGEVEFEDMESGRRIRLEPAFLREQYNSDVAAWIDRLSRNCKNHHIDYNLLRTDTPFDVALTAYLGKRLRLG